MTTVRATVIVTSLTLVDVNSALLLAIGLRPARSTIASECSLPLRGSHSINARAVAAKNGVVSRAVVVRGRTLHTKVVRLTRAGKSVHRIITNPM